MPITASQDPAKRALVAAIAASGRYEGRLNFFRPDGPADSDETLAGTIAQQIGIAQTPCFAMHVRRTQRAHFIRLYLRAFGDLGFIDVPFFIIRMYMLYASLLCLLACGPQDADFANPIVYDGVFSGARLADLLAWIDEYLTSGGGAVGSSASSSSNAAAVASAMAAVSAAQSGKREAGSEVEVDTDGFDAAAAAAMEDEDDQRGFAVVPKTDCPHLAQCLGSATADAFADAKRAFFSRLLLVLSP